MRYLRFVALLLPLLLLAGCEQRCYRSMSGAVWNTTYHITYNSGRNLEDSVRAVMRRVELSLSPFNEASVISAVNRGEDVRVDSLIVKVFECAGYVSGLSGGLYDPTLAPLINLWGFGYRDAGSEPSEEDIVRALESVGIRECGITPDRRVRKKHPLTEFNFSSITKGLGCDEIGAMFRRNGCVDYMVEIGGEIAVGGVSDKGRPWRIAVERPVECVTVGDREAISLIDVTDCGVATSGNYRNFKVDESGRHYGHTISAVTGRPVTTSVLSATVVAPDCMLADALSTTAMLLPPGEAVALADKVEGVWVMIVTLDDSGGYVIMEGGTRPE